MGVTLLQSPMLYSLISSGACSALPMGVAPEAIVEKSFLSIGSRDNVTRHTSTRNISPAKIFNSRYFQEHLVVEFQSSTSMKSSIQFFMKVTAPKAVIKNLSHMILFINSASVGAILYPLYFLFYCINDDVTLPQHGPLYG
jgi:hypothetical protein